MRTAAIIFGLGFAVSIAGDACHVAAGVTRYEWDGVPVLWRSAIWFPLLVAGGVLALAVLGRHSRSAPARTRASTDVPAAAAAVLALYALTAVVHEQPQTVSMVLCSAVAILVWGIWDPSRGAALGGAIAAAAGPLAEIGVVAAGAASYAEDSDGLVGVAPWLVPLYFAAGAVAYRLWPALEGGDAT